MSKEKKCEVGKGSIKIVNEDVMEEEIEEPRMSEEDTNTPRVESMDMTKDISQSSHTHQLESKKENIANMGVYGNSN